MLYRERMSQANKEAKVTLVGVAIVIVCWLLFGFGLYGVDIEIFSTPLWIVMGCLGTWIVAMIVSVILATKVIEDCPLDEDDFGRKYQISDETPVQVTPMTIDQDLIKTIEKTRSPHENPSAIPHIARTSAATKKRRDDLVNADPSSCLPFRLPYRCLPY